MKSHLMPTKRLRLVCYRRHELRLTKRTLRRDINALPNFMRNCMRVALASGGRMSDFQKRRRRRQKGESLTYFLTTGNES
ncbi:hypothetical protein GPN2_10677 [Streptomyces murinus]